MIKDFYVINRETSVIEQIVTTESTTASSLYPDKLLIEVDQTHGAPRVFAGSLYHLGQFWAPVKTLIDQPTVITHLQFRDLFTFPEQLKMDNFMTDPTLTDEHKKIFYTNTKTLDAAMDIDLNSKWIVAGLGFLVSIGYLSQERMDQIMRMETPNE